VTDCKIDRDDPFAKTVQAFAAHFDSVQQLRVSRTIAERYPQVPWEDVSFLVREAFHISVRDFLNSPQLPYSNDTSLDSTLSTDRPSPHQAGPIVLAPVFENGEAAQVDPRPASPTELLRDLNNINTSEHPSFPEIQVPGLDPEFSENTNEMSQPDIDFLEAGVWRWHSESPTS
jgi:hypothetical protein